MTRPAVFTQGDIAKLLKGAKAAGYSVASVEIDPTGRIVAKFGKVSDDTVSGNEWDEVLPHDEEQRAAS